MNDRIQSALSTDKENAKVEEGQPEASVPVEESAKPVSKIVTTEEEQEAYFIIKNMLKDIVPPSDITHKDTESYFNILYKNNSWKWICRLKLSDARKILIIPYENKKDQKFYLDDLYDIEKYKEQLAEVLQRYLK